MALRADTGISADLVLEDYHTVSQLFLTDVIKNMVELLSKY